MIVIWIGRIADPCRETETGTEIGYARMRNSVGASEAVAKWKAWA